MHCDQAVYRALFEALHEYEGDSLYTDVLAPWAHTQTRVFDWLRAFEERQGDPIPPATTEDLWQLYALSRVFDVLLLPFQNGRADDYDWAGPLILLEEYGAFAEALGLGVLQPTEFSPFYHEVVEVEPATDPMEPARVLEHKWPSLILGNMLFARSGVRVSAGRNVLTPGVADASTLYWAFRRKNRPFQDLSHGWGGNSQWRTRFRRDYHVGGTFYYNVDGKRDLATFEPTANDDDLNREERSELLINRCFVTIKKPHSDLWPYDGYVRIPEPKSNI